MRGGADARQHRRVVLEAPVQVYIGACPDLFLRWCRHLTAKTQNVSATGLLLCLDHPLAAGAKVCVAIPVEEGGRTQTLKLKGLVVWCRADAIGETFHAGIDLDDHPRRAMEIWTRTIYDEIRRQGGG